MSDSFQAWAAYFRLIKCCSIICTVSEGDANVSRSSAKLRCQLKDSLVATLASIEYCAPLICASELQRIVPHLWPAAFGACLLDDGVRLHIGRSQGLDS